jgi:hypothetical protein
MIEHSPIPMAGENNTAGVPDTPDGHKRLVMKYPSNNETAIPIRPGIIGQTVF